MSDAGVIAKVVVRMKVRERLYVMLYSAALEEQLKRLYEAGKRRVAAYVDVGGSTFKIVTAVVKKNGRYYLYPMQEAQHLFADYYNLTAGARGRHALVFINKIEEL